MNGKHLDPNDCTSFQISIAFFGLYVYFTKGDPNLTMKDFFFIKTLKASSVPQIDHSLNLISLHLTIDLLEPMI